MAWLKSVRAYGGEKIEFLARELGWESSSFEDLQSLSMQDFLRGNEEHVVLIGNDHREVKKISHLPEASVWVYVYADETYSPRLNFTILRCKAVKGVLRAYPLPSKHVFTLQKLWIKYSVQFLKTPTSSLLEKLKLTFKGQVLVQRQCLARSLHQVYRKTNLNFVPGYTNLFAKALIKKLRIDNQQDSLLHAVLIDSDNEIFGQSVRKFKFSFVGQKGNAWRQYLIISSKAHLESNAFHVICRDSFGGTEGANNAGVKTAHEYLTVLLDSTYVICPGGNYSSATFRLVESLIVGCIPIYSARSPIDPGYQVDFLQTEIYDPESPWSEIIDKAAKVSFDEITSEWLRLTKALQIYLQGVTNSILGEKK